MFQFVDLQITKFQTIFLLHMRSHRSIIIIFLIQCISAFLCIISKNMGLGELLSLHETNQSAISIDHLM